MDRAPTQKEARKGMNKIGQVFAAQAELVPFSGKYSLFGKIFASYDFYAFGGPGFINFISDQGVCATPANSCPVTGLKIGGNFGVGMRSYFNHFFSMDVEIRDLLLRNNPAGRDETGDRVADDQDLTWDSTYMVGINLTFFLPPRAKSASKTASKTATGEPRPDRPLRPTTATIGPPSPWRRRKKKVTLYFNAAMLAETQKEALRQDRSVSWIIQAAWRLAREEIRRMPGALAGSSGKARGVQSHAAPFGGAGLEPTEQDRALLNIPSFRAVRNGGERVC